jgi:acyl transferase domain-containing protein/aryl carrier-like protein
MSMDVEDQTQDGLNGSEVAVIGMAGRFPGAATIERFWENLKSGTESIRFFSDEELLAAGVSPELIADPAYVKAAPVLDGVEMFDAALFDVPPHEARLLDPQHRLFLECVWEALERAGYNSESYPGLIGVFAGSNRNGYLFNLISDPEILRMTSPLQIEAALNSDYLTTRVSYKLDLGGPSLAVQTACSTSLVAVHLACQSLLSGECDIALAGGATVRVPQIAGYIAYEGGIESPDGHCRAFDGSAQGTVFGSGVGLVVLKRMEDALADGDTIRAVVKGSAINNDGARKIGYTAPGADGQSKVIRAAHLMAEVPAETITYVEAHGTATPLGDPIEVSALTKAFREGTDQKGFCAIGSVKTNVGHLECAAGAAGLIKAVLALEHRQIPPSLHLERPNPQIDFASSPFYVNDRLTEWEPAPGASLRAGVHSFGVGGTNAHVVLEEAPPAAPSGPSRPWQLLLLSAASPTALARVRADLSEHFRRHPDLSLADAAFTLRVGRRTGKHRCALVCRDLEDAVRALDAPHSERVLTAVQEMRDQPVVFLLPGSGTLSPESLRELYDDEPAFRSGIDRCCDVLRPRLGLDLRELLFSRPGQEARLTQAVLFMIEHSLAGLWSEWGVRPRAIIGRGVGEYVAACLAGVFSLEDALALVVEQKVSAVRREPPRIPFISNVTGTWITEQEAGDPDYWVRRLEAPGLSDARLRGLVADSSAVLLEVGSGEGRSAGEALLTALGRLWLAGATIDWRGFHGEEERRRIELPAYPFERQRYWVDRLKVSAAAAETIAPQSQDGRRGLQRFPRPELETPYVEPSGEVEPVLAEIWRGVLGLDRVGSQDNFFDLGGDSVVAIQMMAQARKRGLGLSPEHLFRHQTIAALAGVLAPAAPIRPLQETTAPPPDERQLTPADFQDSGLSQESLDRLLVKLKGRS